MSLDRRAFLAASVAAATAACQKTISEKQSSSAAKSASKLGIPWPLSRPRRRRSAPQQHRRGPVSGRAQAPVPERGGFLRGGSWLIVPESLHASNRHRYRPGSRYSYVGFRCAREVSPLSGFHRGTWAHLDRQRRLDELAKEAFRETYEFVSRTFLPPRSEGQVSS